MSDKIEIADHVHHKPSGENWVVGRVDETHVYPCGWPESRAQLSDCVLTWKANEESRADLIEKLKKLPASDSRHYRSET